MWWVELFDADHEFIGRMLTPAALRDYDKVVQTGSRDLPMLDALEQADLDRDGTLSNAELIVYATRLKRGDEREETMRKLTCLVLAEVLSSLAVEPHERDHFLFRVAHHEVLQLSVPRTPDDEAELQWRQTTEEERKLVLCELDPRTRAGYLRQMRESAELRKRWVT